MKKEVKILIILTLTVLIGAVVAAKIYQTATPVQDSTEQATVSESSTQEGAAKGESNVEHQSSKLIRSDSYSLGPSMARVTIVEFLDPECESCKAFFPIMKQVLKEYEGRIHFVVRYMGFHKSSAMAVAATEAAGLQGKYWEMQELLFEKAEEWGHQPVPEEAFFVKYATQLGLDVGQFKRDLADPRWREKLERDMSDGSALGVRGTPTIFVNGRRLQELSYDALVHEIELVTGQ